MTPTKVQVENEKIAQAMKGRAAARRRTPTVKTPDQIIAQAQADGILPEVPASVQDAQNIVAAGIGVGPRSRPMTAKERAVSGRKATPAPKPSQKGKAKPKASRKAATPKAAKPKTPRVLPDPVDNARLIRMRAKWTAIRRERDVARLEEKVEQTPDDATLLSSLQVAQAEYRAAVQAEHDAYEAYRVLLEARKAQKAAPAETASPTAETVVADPDDLDATINAQAESR